MCVDFQTLRDHASMSQTSLLLSFCIKDIFALKEGMTFGDAESNEPEEKEAMFC